VTDPVETGDAPTEPARRRLRAEKGFHIHLAVYALVNAFLFLINSRTGSPGWFFWPAFG
jgi:2TM domain